MTTQIAALGHSSLQCREYLFVICPRQMHAVSRFTFRFLANSVQSSCEESSKQESQNILEKASISRHFTPGQSSPVNRVIHKFFHKISTARQIHNLCLVELLHMAAGHGRSGWEEPTSSKTLTEFADCLSFILPSNGGARYKNSLGSALWLNQGCFTPITIS